MLYIPNPPPSAPYLCLCLLDPYRCLPVPPCPLFSVYPTTLTPAFPSYVSAPLPLSSPFQAAQQWTLPTLRRGATPVQFHLLTRPRCVVSLDVVPHTARRTRGVGLCFGGCGCAVFMHQPWILPSCCRCRRRRPFPTDHLNPREEERRRWL